MESEGIAPLIDMAPPWVDTLFSAMGALIVLGAVFILIAAVWYIRSVVKDREAQRARRKPALWGPRIHRGDEPSGGGPGP
jgi:hypothetical protein